MDIAAASSVDSQLLATAAPLASRQADGNAPKRDRRLTLTKIDKRGRFGRRVAELTALFAASISGETSPMMRLKIEKAAQLTAIAELARGDFMRDGKGTLDDIVRLERKADQAVRALRLVDGPPKPPSLLEHLARAAAERGR